MNPADSVEEFKNSIAGAPANYWIVITNPGPGHTVISLPAKGTLWVHYSFRTPAERIYIRHQGGPSTAIKPGEQKIPVNASDQLIYELANPGEHEIKLAYQYV